MAKKIEVAGDMSIGSKSTSASNSKNTTLVKSVNNILKSNKKVEMIFAEMLSNKLVDYYLENGKLILYLEDDSKLFFKRKDL